MIPFSCFLDPAEQAHPVTRGECTVAALRQNLRDREASELFEGLVLDPVSTPFATVPAVGHLLQPATLEVTA